METGNEIDIWKDRWMPRSSSFLIQFPINTLDCNAKVAELINQDTKSWKEELVRSVFLKEEANIICKLPVSMFGARDKLI